ncbi:hypothetical protein AWB80_06607 [Caballeronia pedi]|uniref:Major facilitator transporter n=1 Tax=Caballeronia pedi TaxID=1777141 RepID=A0A158DBJ4_9BURK|nr:hypothetical protein [Caballeronia pedi]SAK91861.1 hypothetical protein AWB80_06607 [Caballeronia pedi]
MSKNEDAAANEQVIDRTNQATRDPHETQDETSAEHEAPTVARTGPLTEAKLFGRQTPPAAGAPADAPPHVHGGAGSSYRALAGLLCSYALLIVGNGLFQTLIPLRILQSGYPTIVIGLIQSCY